VDPSLPELHAPSLSLRGGDFAIHVRSYALCSSFLRMAEIYPTNV